MFEICWIHKMIKTMIEYIIFLNGEKKEKMNVDALFNWINLDLI